MDASTRKLIQRLTDALAEATESPRAPTVAFLLGQARSLLSTLPKVEGDPTDEEIDKLEQSMWETTGVTEHLQQEQVFNYREFLRKGLALWGSPAPTTQAEENVQP